MKGLFKKSLVKTLVFGVLAGGAANAMAQGAFPDRAITIVVGSQAGSAPDVLARILAMEMGNELKQSIIVENKPGATGSIGAGYVATSQPDGYTLLMGTVSNIALAPLGKSVRYKASDFATVSAVASVPLVLVTAPDANVHSLSDLKALAAKTPGGLAYSSPGIGGPQHLAGLLLQKELDIPLLHVPYKSGAAAALAVASGETQLTFAGVSAALPLINSKKVAPVFVTSPTPLQALPGVPSAVDIKAPGFLVDNWHGLFAPKDLPQPVADTLAAAVQKALKSDSVQKKFTAQGAEVDLRDAAKYSEFVREEAVRWSNVVKENGLTL